MQYASLVSEVGKPIPVEPLVYCHARGGVVTDGECVKRSKSVNEAPQVLTMGAT